MIKSDPSLAENINGLWTKVLKGAEKSHDPLSKYIPKMKDTGITLYQLATHTSGLPRDANNMKIKWKDRHNPFKNFQLSDAYYFIENYVSKKKPTHKPSYSNIGMAMLGNVLTANDFNTHIGFSHEDKIGVVVFDNIHLGLFDILKMTIKKEYTNVERLAESLYEDVINT
jgi:hypothetical protein